MSALPRPKRCARVARPVLRPELTFGGIVLAIFVTLIVSVIAVIFPLVLATRIQPIVAMQASES